MQGYFGGVSRTKSNNEDRAFFENSKWLKAITQSAFTCSKLTIETLDQGVKYVQSY